MDMDVDGHRKFGIIAPLNFAIISSGQTDGEREGWVFRDSLMISYQARYYSMTDHLVDEKVCSQVLPSLFNSLSMSGVSST